MLWMIYMQIICFLLGLGLGIAFFVTGRKNRLLSAGAGVFLILGSVLQLLNQSA